ncbi:hypothetical protein VTI74DRAFT_8112 [Chaetomium olivicolor]
MAPTPDIEFPASPPPPQRSRVAFASVSPPHRGSPTGADTPSSIGLGIGANSEGTQFPGYHRVVSRDSFQQDSPPTSPPLANDSSKSNLHQQEYALASPDAAGYYYPHQYGGLPPPSGPGDNGFTGSTWWRMLSSGWPMFGLFLLGFGFAVGHHVFYSHLDGKPADDQIRMMRFGGLLSYAAKATLLAAVIFAYRQQTWVTVRSNILQLRTIDGVFAAVNEPLVLWNWELFKKARISVSLAILAWLFPLTVILTPATLTVASLTEVKDDLCPNIRTLNFEPEKKKNWRVPTLIDGERIFSLSNFNSTVKDSNGMFDVSFDDTFFDYYTGPTGPITLVTQQSILTGAVIPRRNVALETCGAGWNCSYTVSFVAPAYKCSEMARGNPGERLDEAALMAQGVPLHVGELLPNGNYSYLGNASVGEYSSRQTEVGIGGWPLKGPPFPKNLGAFRTEPKIWVAYSEAATPGNYPNNRSIDDFYTAYKPVLVSCEHYLTNYTVLFNHTFTDQTTTVLRRDYLRPIVDTTFVPGKNAKDGTLDNTTATPESNYVFPMPDFETYRLVAAYHSLAAKMRPFLDGVVQYHPFANPISEVSQTALMDTNTYLPIPNLVEHIPRFYENIIFSLFSNPRFLVVAWAAKPEKLSGSGNATDPEYLYPCNKVRVFNAYVYNKRDFWIGYSFAIGGAVMAVVLGSAAISSNNFHVRDVHVSSIVAATRAPCLESLPWKSSKWGEVPPEILNTKLGYGIVADTGPNGTPAAGAVAMGVGGNAWFGSPSTVSVMEGRGTTGSGERVYYGFAPREVLERTRAARAATFGPGKPRSRTSAFSFRNWEQHY